MARMTGGEAIVGQLRKHGTNTVFGLPGAQVYGLFDAFQRDGMRVVTPRHEQACGYMAFGYARASGRAGVCAVVPGPGILNAGAALLTAWGCNTPVLCLTGQVPSSFLGKGRGHLHEMPDQRSTLAGIVKWAGRAETVHSAPYQVARAFQEMTSLRPGPASVEMPWEQFLAAAEVELVEPLAPVPDPTAGEAIGEAAREISAARSPMIFVGSGAIGASHLVQELAERIDAPVVAFRSGRGVVSSRHELGLTMAEARHLWPSVDCLIGIGSRLEMPGWRWPSRPDVPTIRIDIDVAELRRAPAKVQVPGRAEMCVKALLEELPPMPAKPRWREAIARARATAMDEIAAITPHAQFLAVIRAAMPDDGIFVDEICQAGFTSWSAFPVYAPRTFISTGYQGTLGYGFATALGVKVARPEAAVVSITGDGGFMFAVQELATAAQFGIGVVTVLFNNGAFGNVRRDQREGFDGRVIGSELCNPDFQALAGSFGINAVRAATPEELGAKLHSAIADGRPWLIEVPVDAETETSPWPLIQA